MSEEERLMKILKELVWEKIMDGSFVVNHDGRIYNYVNGEYICEYSMIHEHDSIDC